ncbi:MAG: MATE family efflux transporter [Clostridium perfringens]|uniref:MATE family efflux transporter n=1 Tax=Clostridium perfringens TaxID=1502 RepID=UPI002247D3F1|nr:MATE family efflux transporter [Clostridium perfringens]MCX0392249.1 MATE family efflux transporter [Clostridium perfringens]MDK0694076.1 MATE family efflux transporter [Clostridium perfringens]
MDKRIDLTEGKITSNLIKLSIPIMATSFIQMAYNMADMIWVGRIGSNAVAAVGTAGFFPWLGMAFVMISKVGAEIKVAQSLGRNDIDSTKDYIKSAFQINIILAIIYSIILLLFNSQLIGFFDLGDAEVIKMAKTYLIAVALGMIFNFLNPVFTAVFTGSGDSRTPFIANTIGLIFNIVFDPILIFGIGIFPEMGVLGAALATVLAQVIVTVTFLYIMIKSKAEYLKINILSGIKINCMKTLFHIGLPAALQSGLFTIFSMFIGKIVAVFGPVPIAVQKVGSQVEAIAWMTAGGISTALSTFVGQNYGAGKLKRIVKGFNITMIISLIVGVFASLVLIFFGEEIFRIFIPEAQAIEQGTVYLKILGYCQILVCVEITTTGAFNGLGRTYIPSIISILLTGARIPMAYIMCKPEFLGLEGIWWAISITGALKGVVVYSIYRYLYKKNKLFKVYKDENGEECISI